MWKMTIVATLVCAAACSSPFAVDRDALPLTETDRVSLAFEAGDFPGRFGVSVAFRFFNATEKTLTLVFCANDVPLLERSTPEGWTYVAGGGDLGCLSEPRHIPPGTAIRDTARFEWGNPGEGRPVFVAGEMAGTYRLRWHQMWADFSDYDPRTRTWGTPVPEFLLVSNSFELSAPW
jgi:hypothetical protein